MGADIHLFVEKWTSSNDYEGPRDLPEDREQKLNELLEGFPAKSRWVSADKWELRNFSIEDSSWQVNFEYYGSRNYYLFSILADVRNSSDVVPISDPRGIPDDASFGYLQMCDYWDSDAHSHSYFTLDELLDVDWSKYDIELIAEFLNSLDDMKKIDEDAINVRCCFFFDN